MQKNPNRYFFFILVCFLLSITGCQEEKPGTPRPKGYMKIDFPQKKYVEHNTNCPYTFQYPLRSIIDTNTRRVKHPCWLNLHYPQYGATIHMTYTNIQKDSLHVYIEDAHKLAMKHVVRADDIKERLFENDEERVYGVAYELEGNVASNFQFFLTDSNQHFLRGALYFNMKPNPDSLAPVIQYINQDIYQIIESLEWQGI